MFKIDIIQTRLCENRNFPERFKFFKTGLKSQISKMSDRHYDRSNRSFERVPIVSFYLPLVPSKVLTQID